MQVDNFEIKKFPGIESVGLSTAQHRLRVCIITEEIIGPVRNGGIASTYYHLSKGLAAQGHEVHVLFLKGPVVQDETPEHWVEHFAAFGVTLHYLDIPDRPMWAAATGWQARFAAAYQWLREAETFDVVHTSEWRGGMVYALMAKRLGLAFQETLFLVKTSSPHIWNRHYQMQPIQRAELVLAAYAEQKCVELADVVIGGSAHLITFMGEIGYKVQDENVFVQPNIVDFSKVIVTDARPPRKPGDVVKTQELIFFGRLEGRKGIELMCNALDILKERGIGPERMTFMGKWGAPLATQGGMKVEAYLSQKAENWDFPVDYITDKNQPEALSHMCSRDMIAIMPSLIENSTMAVYETLENKIPFLATATGGTPELIDAQDHDACLVAPKATALADQVQRMLEEGQVIAHPSFSNDENLTIWYGFHAHLAEQIAEKGRGPAIAEIAQKVDRPGPEVKTLDYVVLARREDDLEALAAALAEARPDRVLLGYNDAAMRAPSEAAGQTLQDAGISASVVELIGLAAGDALNHLAGASESDAMIVAHGADVTPRAGFVEAAKQGLSTRPDCLFTSFFASELALGAPIGGDVASQLLSSRAYGPELFALTAATYARLGGFEPYDVRQGILHEYVTRAVEVGPDDLLVFPEELIDWPGAAEATQSLSEDTVYAYLKAKPLIDGASLAERKVLLASLHQTRSGPQASGLADALLRDPARPEEAPLWLMPTDWVRNDLKAALRRQLLVGLDEARKTLWLYARGPGARILRYRDEAPELTLMREDGAADSEGYQTLHSFVVPDAWEPGASYALNWELHTDGEKQRGVFFRINKIGTHAFVLSSKQPLMTPKLLDEVIDWRINRAKALEAEKAKALEAERIKALAAETAMVQAENAAKAPEAEADQPPPAVAQPEPQSKSAAPMPAKAVAKPGIKRVEFSLKETDILLDLARTAGRLGLERKTLAIQSRHLLSTVKPATQKGDIRTFLHGPKSGAVWAKNDWLIGWAWDRNDPTQILHVAVMQDETPLFLVKANVEMPGLGKRTPGLETHGFRIPVMPDFFTEARRHLSLRVWDSGSAVRGARLVRSGAEGYALEAAEAAHQEAETT